ncbi:MAG: WbqC family protein, partial [Acidimicrobiales bacterium]
SLINVCDRWVVFDTSQYTPKTWMNRNRLLHPQSGWLWMTVPVVSAPRETPIRDIRLHNPQRARQTINGQLGHYRRVAPHWQQVETLVDEVFSGLQGDSLVELDIRSLAAVCSYLGLGFEPLVASALPLALPTVDHPGGWAPAVAAALRADSYVNPIGGVHLFDLAEFAEVGVQLRLLEQPAFSYPTGPFRFEPSLSILDVLMWNDVDAVRQAIGEARLLSFAQATDRVAADAASDLPTFPAPV